MRIRNRIIPNATPVAAELLCVFQDNGVLTNVMVTSPGLAVDLAAAETPEEREAIEDAIFAAADDLSGVVSERPE